MQPALVRAVANRAAVNQRQVAATNTFGFTFAQTSLSSAVVSTLPACLGIDFGSTSNFGYCKAAYSIIQKSISEA